MTDQPILDDPKRAAFLEAVLFVAANPVPITQLAELFECSGDEMGREINELKRYLEERDSGLAVQIHAGRVQLTTAPHMAVMVERFLGLEMGSHLSRAAIETLAIIAYRQPITRPGIDAIRGVSSDGVIRSLLTKGLISEIGRAEGPGRPILYGTSAEFLQHFGLSRLEDMPPFESTTDNEQRNGILKD